MIREHRESPITTSTPAKAALLLAAVLLGAVAAVRGYDLADAFRLSEDPGDVMRTWDQAWLFVPGWAVARAESPIMGPLNASHVQQRLADLPPDLKLPVMVFLHGCTGFNYPERHVERVLGRLGYAVIFPNSFARRLRPRDCDYQSRTWGLFPLAFLYRRAELIHAVARLREQPWVDQRNIFLGGFDEGAVATALWGGEVEATGYVIAGWTCTAPQSLRWITGLRTPTQRPVLNIVSRNDQWFRWTGFEGDCRAAADGHEKFTLLAVDGSVHNVLVYPEAQRKLGEFLLLHTVDGAHTPRSIPPNLRPVLEADALYQRMDDLVPPPAPSAVPGQ